MIDLNIYSPFLIEKLIELGDEYGPIGVALVAAKLADPKLVARLLVKREEEP